MGASTIPGCAGPTASIPCPPERSPRGDRGAVALIAPATRTLPKVHVAGCVLIGLQKGTTWPRILVLPEVSCFALFLSGSRHVADLDRRISGAVLRLWVFLPLHPSGDGEIHSPEEALGSRSCKFTNAASRRSALASCSSTCGSMSWHCCSSSSTWKWPSSFRGRPCSASRRN